MYDHIKLKFRKDKSDFILNRIHHNVLFNEKYNPNNGTLQSISTTDLLKGLYVKESHRYIIVNNSLTKHVKGNNFDCLSIQEIETSIKNICKTLTIPINELFVTEFEFGTNIEVDENVKYYIGILKNSRKFHLSNFSNSLYFHNSVNINDSSIKLKFYDKKKERRTKRRQSEIPDFLVNANILRYEIVIKVKKYFNKELLVSQLYDKTFISYLLEIWFSNFDSIIIKQNNDLFFPTNYSELSKYIFKKGVEEIGLENIYYIIDNARAKNSWGYRHKNNYSSKKRSVLEKYIKELTQKPSPLHKELICKINSVYNNIKKYYKIDIKQTPRPPP